ncbi:mitochondrial 39-S ribosomal protein L47 (MRP-L47)-domain-containing protein [Mrakia frigida]|uniref:mitochondrial 54S ribosomal protein uL29m MRPL4 n=1 Tax=Mrakia frigida TaxID=29902 RepID=UPI003FCBFC6F
MLARLFSTTPRILSNLSSSSSSHASTSFLAPSSLLPSSRRSLSSSLPSFLPSSSSNPSSSLTKTDDSSPEETSIAKESEEEDDDDEPARTMKPSSHEPLVFEPPRTQRPVSQDATDFIDPTTGKLYPPSLLPRTNPIPKFVVKRQYKDEIEVDPDHPLWAFFHRDPKTGEALTMEKLDENALDMIRPWQASELRVKSFQDLHTLWALLLREKNIYYTQKAEIRRKEADKTRDWGTKKTRHMIQLSMARIKLVLNERQIVYKNEAARAQREARTASEMEKLEQERLMVEDLEEQVEEAEQEEEAEVDEIEEDQQARDEEGETSKQTKA